MNPPSESPAQVRVLHKTLDILEVLKRETSGINLAFVSRSVGMPKPTVYRILNTLKSRGYVDRRSDGTYRVSAKLFCLHHQRSREEVLLQAAKPVMINLSVACQETVNLAVLDGADMVIIGTVESPQSLRLITRVGNRRHLHTTALGKALGARMEEEEVRRVLNVRGLPRMTPRSLVSEAKFLASLKTIRRVGFAIDNQENETGVRCIASVVEGAFGKPLASLSISGPAFRLDLQRLRSFCTDLQKSCLAISDALKEAKGR